MPDPSFLSACAFSAPLCHVIYSLNIGLVHKSAGAFIHIGFSVRTRSILLHFMRHTSPFSCYTVSTV